MRVVEIRKRPYFSVEGADELRPERSQHQDRDYKDRAKDLLYMHDTIEVLSEHLGELRTIFRKEVEPRLRARRTAELEGAADRLFGKIDDTIREATLMTTGRKLSPERLAETSRAGLKEIFSSKKKA